MAHEVLSRYAARPGDVNRCGQDAGPVVLAAALLSVEPGFGSTADAALERWLDELPEEVTGVGPFGGLGGFIAGLRAAMTFSAAVEPLHRAVCGRTEDWLGQVRWRSSHVAWSDYDFFTGPAGAILAGATRESPGGAFRPAWRHLTAMCEYPGLEAFRAGDEIDPRSSFNVGRINTGLGHGLAGVASALDHAANVIDGAAEECRPALRRIADWLVNECLVDERGLTTWPPVGADGGTSKASFNRRQAWCYGTPGVSWALWSSARTLDDRSCEDVAREAIRTFCRLFDEELYLDPGPPSERLGICHGAAGTLAVADAFLRHAEIQEAGELRGHLTEYLLDSVDDVRVIGATDMTVLTGAAGILTVLLTSMGGDRAWLQQIALR